MTVVVIPSECEESRSDEKPILRWSKRPYASNLQATCLRPRIDLFVIGFAAEKLHFAASFFRSESEISTYGFGTQFTFTVIYCCFENDDVAFLINDTGA